MNRTFLLAMTVLAITFAFYVVIFSVLGILASVVYGVVAAAFGWPLLPWWVFAISLFLLHAVLGRSNSK